jgi:hypothetical protein
MPISHVLSVAFAATNKVSGIGKKIIPLRLSPLTRIVLNKESCFTQFIIWNDEATELMK